jgi:hypothetical protein
MAKAAAKAEGKKRGRKSNAEKAAAKAAAEQSKPEAQPQPSPASEVQAAKSVNLKHKAKLPDRGVIPRLVKSLSSQQGDVRDITSAMAESIKKAQENKHVDKWALAQIRAFYRKFLSQPQAFAIGLNHFLAYLEEMDLANLADKAMGADLADPPREDGDDAHANATAAEAAQTTEAEWNAAAPGKPGLSIVPGPAAPTESDVPPAPDSESEAA